MFIYILNAQGTDLYKIGITTRTTSKRIKNLQTGNGNIIIEVYKHESEYANVIEKMLHRHFSHLRNKGEWFNFSEISVEDVKKKLHSFEDIINNLENEQKKSID